MPRDLFIYIREFSGKTHIKFIAVGLFIDVVSSYIRCLVRIYIFIYIYYFKCTLEPFFSRSLSLLPKVFIGNLNTKKYCMPCISIKKRMFCIYEQRIIDIPVTCRNFVNDY